MYKEVDLEYINEIIENREEHLNELVIARDREFYIACDNSTGNAWVEEFESKEEAVNWLKNIWEDEEH